MTGSGQADKLAACERDSRGFDSFYPQSISSAGVSAYHSFFLVKMMSILVRLIKEVKRMIKKHWTKRKVD